ncbi:MULTISPECIES: fimbrial protein [Providencia]|uniref:Type 1 fimbriae major subunit n=1 Tax=Providencia heimbachae ATCC 35613 TaxID=1354272 RepID=A0A1B7JTY4_9GAMM|nr:MULTISPECIES: fimbrial protein [Providencia]MBP6123885.1 fimbrial protein [Providencia sp.]NIH20881.1 fimbrial protein [Providencia heimbachae]OAT51345.1 type 1 fimbriae major subunit [Providencia heimbachae ATCC 35613]QCJ68513.1 fimbrial protein [Providencia heimbachae]SQH11508.1 Type-1A pilin [Providencia heimbachae]
MRGLMLSLLLLFSSLLEAGNQWKVQLPGGGMRFQGELIAEACSVDTSDRMLTVNMGQLRTNMLHAPGQDTAPVIFDIHLRECSNAVSESVSITFSGVANDKNPDIFSIGEGPDTATGMGLAIFDSKNTLIPINSSPRKISQLSNGDMTLHFIAKYRATSYQITGGKANAEALFSLTYE